MRKRFICAVILVFAFISLPDVGEAKFGGSSSSGSRTSPSISTTPKSSSSSSSYSGSTSGNSGSGRTSSPSGSSSSSSSSSSNITKPSNPANSTKSSTVNKGTSTSQNKAASSKKGISSSSFPSKLLTAAGVYLILDSIDDAGEPVYVNADTGENVEYTEEVEDMVETASSDSELSNYEESSAPASDVSIEETGIFDLLSLVFSVLMNVLPLAVFLVVGVLFYKFKKSRN